MVEEEQKEEQLPHQNEEESSPIGYDQKDEAVQSAKGPVVKDNFPLLQKMLLGGL